MVKFEDLKIGQQVFVHLGTDYVGCDERGWLAVKVNLLIGDKEPNPGRTLVEVVSPWLECGWGMFDWEAEDNIYAPQGLATFINHFHLVMGLDVGGGDFSQDVFSKLREKGKRAERKKRSTRYS